MEETALTSPWWLVFLAPAAAYTIYLTVWYTRKLISSRALLKDDESSPEIRENAKLASHHAIDGLALSAGLAFMLITGAGINVYHHFF